MEFLSNLFTPNQDYNKNGGISKVIESTAEEKNILGALTELDDVVQGMRNKLRYGEKLELDFEIKKK